ncbi:MAG: baseplate J/gp47 family protein [Rhodospirillales bacterium]|nr:baseplate J/gp47 family protein [Rhodospirillales bacterium]
MLTFGRAVSGDDYETLAAQTPGVRRARAYWSWDGGSQRTLVKVFVGDDDAAVVAATAALHAFADPNRPVLVALAAPMYADISFTLEVDPAYEADSVRTAVSAALLDLRNDIFGIETVRIGHTVYDSHIHEACLHIDGVRAVRALRIRDLDAGAPRARPRLGTSPGTGAPASDIAARRIALDTLDLLDPEGVALGPGWLADRVDPPSLGPRIILQDVLRLESGERHSPGEGGFYLLRGDRLHITAEVARHGE